MRSRSLSHDEIKPVEVLSKASPVKKNNESPNEKTMIDEIYKLAKEDVQKRIASIEKKLIENGHYDMSKNTPRDNSVRSARSARSQSPNVQLLSKSSEKEKQTTNKRNEEKLIQRTGSPKVFEISKPDQQYKRTELPKKKTEESPLKDVKIIPNKTATPSRSNYGSPQNYTSNKNLSFNIGSSEKETKPITRPSNTRIERENSLRKEKVGNESINKRSQQVVQDPESIFISDYCLLMILAPKSYTSKRSENNKTLNVKIISPKRK